MIRLITQFIANWTTIIIAPIMTLIVGKRFWQLYKEKNVLNYIRLLIFLIFLAFSWAIIPTNLSEVPPLNVVIDKELIGTNLLSINPYSFAIGLMVTFSLIMIAYANRWEVLYYIPLFLFGGILVFYFLNNNHPIFLTLNQLYILVAGVIGLIFFYITGFRLKDNGSLGLGIFFTLSYSSLIAGENVIGDIFTFLIGLFGLIFALGYFEPFKEENY